MNTPFGPAINLGTLDSPNYAGSAGGVAYLRGIHTALAVLRDLDDRSHWDGPPEAVALDCIEAVQRLLTHPNSTHPGATPTPTEGKYTSLTTDPNATPTPNYKGRGA